MKRPVKIELPHSPSSSTLALAQALVSRRSCREYSGEPVSIEQLSQLLWSAQGATGEEGRKAAPSAGAQYPLHVYVLSGIIEDLSVGFYRYEAPARTLHLVTEDDLRNSLCGAVLDEQPWVGEAALVVVLAADFGVMREHFLAQPPRGKRGDRYIYLEAGAVAQNLHLQATALGLGAVLVGGFDDVKLKGVLALPHELEPTALVCIGARPPTTSGSV